ERQLRLLLVPCQATVAAGAGPDRHRRLVLGGVDRVDALRLLLLAGHGIDEQLAVARQRVFGDVGQRPLLAVGEVADDDVGPRQRPGGRPGGGLAGAALTLALGEAA